MRLYLSSFRLGNHPEEFIKLLRGGKKVAVITNAADWKSPEDRIGAVERELVDLESLGLEPTEVDLRPYFGKGDELKEVLNQYDALWVRGGNVFILRRALKQSGADLIIKDFLTQDKLVYAGYSAGPAILTPSLQGIELVDDAQIVPEGYEPKIIWDGLGVLPYALAPHYKSDHPESEAIDLVVEFFTQQGIDFKVLRDGQVLVIDGETENILG